jgi:hypothetical protein
VAAMNPLQLAVSQLGRRGDEYLSRSALAKKYFLNPVVPRAIKDDPDGSYHFRHQISDADGNPIPGLKKGDPIPLHLRWYQKEVVDMRHRRKVLRFGRRTGKSFTLAVDICVEAVTNPKAKILVLTPYENQIKVLFDDYVRPLLKAYRHQRSSAIGLDKRLDGGVPAGHDLAIKTDTKKPQEIVLTNGASIRGMVMTPGTRGQSATYVIVDEADYADNAALQSIVAPIMMTSPETKVMMGSTPSGRTDSFYYQSCHSSDWKEFKRTFEVLPHYDQDLWDQMAAMAGGENTNSFKQEYLADWGTEVAGVFDQKKLNLSFIIAPWARVLEEVNPKTRERTPLFAHTTAKAGVYEDYRIGARSFSWDLGGGRTEVGGESVWQSPSQSPGVITVGTDWNEKAGMQTVMIWWPDKAWLQAGNLKVSRFAYSQGQPITGDRARDAQGRVRTFTVGRDNGDPGGDHDLSSVEGIVIWHGRLEAGYFNWQTAANRVLAMLSIPDFIDAWYVDYGYGAQVLKMIEGGMASAQYVPDGGGKEGFFPKAADIPQQLMRNVLKFHPDQDVERTGKVFKSVNFAKPYPYLDLGYAERGDLTKDVLIALAKQKVYQRKILIPYGELFRLATAEEVGYETVQEFDGTAFGEEQKVEVTSHDVIEETTAETPKGADSFGGLVYQMRVFKEAGRSPTGRPRYEGPDHAIDALMLSILAYQENHALIAPDNVARKDTTFRSAQAEGLLGRTAENAVVRSPVKPDAVRVQSNGDFRHKEYASERQPLEWLVQGKAKPQQVGTSMEEMLRMATRHFGRQGEA